MSDKRPLIRNRLFGMMFRPSAPTLSEFEKTIATSDYHAESGFREKYQNYLGVLHVIAYSAKVYAANNWEKVKDWSELSIAVYDNTGKMTEYYNHKEREKKPIEKNEEGQDPAYDLFDDLNKYEKSKHNPVLSVTQVVLDSSDGDFSITVNDNDHFWISDESVIMFADYIEEQLKKQS